MWIDGWECRISNIPFASPQRKETTNQSHGGLCHITSHAFISVWSFPIQGPVLMEVGGRMTSSRVVSPLVLNFRFGKVSYVVSEKQRHLTHQSTSAY